MPLLTCCAMPGASVAPWRLLWPVSQLYAAAVAAPAAALGGPAPARADVPVIVVGNDCGGAGKTPSTLALLEHLRARGWRPGVVAWLWAAHHRLPWRCALTAWPLDVGDEPLLIARRAQVPVFVAPAYAGRANAAPSPHPTNAIVCDDGSEHLALARDGNLGSNDEGRGQRLAAPGYGRPLPAGDGSARRCLTAAASQPGRLRCSATCPPWTAIPPLIAPAWPGRGGGPA